MWTGYIAKRSNRDRDSLVIFPDPHRRQKRFPKAHADISTVVLIFLSYPWSITTIKESTVCQKMYKRVEYVGTVGAKEIPECSK